MTVKAFLATAAVCAAVVSCADTAGDEIKALKAVISSNSVNRLSKSCRYYTAWYRDLCTEAEREAILERNIAAHRRWIELAGKNGTDPKGAAMPRAELGKVLAIGGRWEEAEKELSEALKYDFDRVKVAAARWALAECLWHRGDKEGAKKQVAEIVAMNGPRDDVTVWEKARFMHRAWTDPDGDLDELTLPHLVDCKPFPTPQDAKYGEKRVSLKKVEIVFATRGSSFAKASASAVATADKSEDKLEDPIVRLLKRKLSRFGSKFEKGGTQVQIEILPDAPVDKPQGYSLDITNGNVAIKARDRLGATWGVVSLIQCIDRN